MAHLLFHGGQRGALRQRGRVHLRAERAPDRQPRLALRRRLPAREGLAALTLFALSLWLPATWWPRYVLGAAMASLVVFALVVLASAGLVETLQRMERPFPARFREALRAALRERD